MHRTQSQKFKLDKAKGSSIQSCVVILEIHLYDRWGKCYLKLCVSAKGSYGSKCVYTVETHCFTVFKPFKLSDGVDF